MADVTFERKDYVDALSDWQLVDDVCAGERAVKHKKEKYLPRPNPEDTGTRNKKRYLQYILRASFYNATGRTLQSNVGSVFRRVPSLLVPADIQYVDTDIDGAGVSIFQQSQSALKAVLKRGRHALYVDYPNIQGSTSKAQQLAGLVRATVVSIGADQVINWRTTKIGGVHKLSLVVIKESFETVSEDGFGSDSKPQYRVLKLQDGQYLVEIWQQDARNSWHVVETYAPLDGKGRAWDEIPFTFIGAQNNDASIDDAPMLDLAIINIAHYRNSADYEDSVYMVGQPQAWMSNVTEQWLKLMKENGVYVGSRELMPVPNGGQFGFAQVEPNTMVKEAMDQKERQMVALGARLVERGQAVKTATEAQSESESQHSVVSLAAANVSEAYMMALGWMARFMNTAGEAVYQLSQDLIEHSLNPQQLTALVGAVQAGKLPESDFWAQMRKFGIIDPEKTDDDIKDELSQQGDGLGLDGGDK